MEGYEIPGDSRFGLFGVYASPDELVRFKMELAKLRCCIKVSLSAPIVRDILYRSNLSFGDTKKAEDEEVSSPAISQISGLN
jgi:hypothetical protein